MRTIGVALALPEPWAGELRDYRAELGDPTAATVPAHVTVMPPAQVEEAALGDVERHLETAATAVDRFELHLRGTGTFRPVSPVVFVSLVAGISQCELLAQAVCDGPLTCDLEFPYHPHVTVAHHLDDAVLDRAFDDLAGFECRFVVDELTLYVHHPDRGWQPTRTFGLSTPPGGPR